MILAISTSATRADRASDSTAMTFGGPPAPGSLSAEADGVQGGMKILLTGRRMLLVSTELVW
ncbi:hypothetical protein OGCDGJMD_00263 [Cyanobium usitatum str. Tous]|nr:hypothetical protein OGCDGJMD_00263 [Cyanobium usitatum str. Tous]